MNLINESKLYDFIRSVRWKKGVFCPRCQSHHIRSRSCIVGNFKYLCHSCGVHFNDLTGTIFANTHIPMWKWIMAIYISSFGQNNQQMGKALGINKNTQNRIWNKIQDILWDFSDEELFGIIEAYELCHSASQVSDRNNEEKKKATHQNVCFCHERDKKYESKLLGIMIIKLLH